MVGLEEFGSGLEVPIEVQLHLEDVNEAGKTCQQSKLDGFPSNCIFEAIREQNLHHFLCLLFLHGDSHVQFSTSLALQADVDQRE